MIYLYINYSVYYYNFCVEMLWKAISRSKTKAVFTDQGNFNTGLHKFHMLWQQHDHQNGTTLEGVWSGEGSNGISVVVLPFSVVFR